MISFLLEYEFAQRALLVGVLVGIIAPLIGMFVVARRLSVIGEVVAHTGLVGIVIGSVLGSSIPLLKGIDESIYGVIFGVLGALAVEGLRKAFSYFAELAIPLMLSVSLGAAVVLFSATEGFNADVFSYLFGNLFSVRASELYMILIFSLIVIAAVIVLFRDLFSITFDEEYSRLNRVRSGWVQLLFIILLALTISITIRAVGVLLVSGLMVLPVATALLLSRGFRITVLLAVMFSELAIIIGFVLSYYLDLASGGAIIVSSLLLLITVLIAGRIVQKEI